MTTIPTEQLQIFFVFIISGIAIGIIFDVFRIIRRSFKISDLHTYIEDIIFGIILGFFLIFIFFIYNSGDVRFYMIVALLIGFLLYMLTISKYFIKINVAIITFIKAALYKILHFILIPVKYIVNFLKKVFNKPFMLLIINIKRLKDVVNYQKYQKKLHKKKDFTK